MNMENKRILHENEYYIFMYASYHKRKRITLFYKRSRTHRATRLSTNPVYWIIDKESGARILKTKDSLKAAKKFEDCTEEKLNRIDKILLEE